MHMDPNKYIYIYIIDIYRIDSKRNIIYIYIYIYMIYICIHTHMHISICSWYIYIHNVIYHLCSIIIWYISTYIQARFASAINLYAVERIGIHPYAPVFHPSCIRTHLYASICLVAHVYGDIWYVCCKKHLLFRKADNTHQFWNWLCGKYSVHSQCRIAHRPKSHKEKKIKISERNMFA